MTDCNVPYNIQHFLLINILLEKSKRPITIQTFAGSLLNELAMLH